ncbi:hypothetical protein [Actinoplanes sp. NPDC089786]|uniref:hypothetical protein n=1 Tax=Actinoplanes sp. NPDC089786 TaxID=3155185 RepID=UPI0034169701
MATSQTPNTSRRRPSVGDRSATAAATPPGTDPTPGTNQHDTGHQDARETPPMAHPPNDPTTPPSPPRRRRTTGDRRTTNNARTQQTADDAPTLTVIVQPRDFRLPDVLRHIEAGKIVLVMPQHNGGD